MDPILLILPPGQARELAGALAKGPRTPAVEVADTLGEGLERSRGGRWGCVVLSLTLDGAGLEIVRALAALPGVGSLLVTHPAPDLDLTLAAEAAGAAAVLPEPPDPVRVRRELDRQAAEGDAVDLPAGEPGDGEPRLVGSSTAMAAVFATIARVASTPATVLIQGESGTGKELVARALHRASPRARGPFVAVNCAAIPEHLLEAELFGHEKGAFTGAVARSEGRFGRAHGGTLFLDEIGDMSLVLQAKILRALEEREIERVGGQGTIPVDVRVVAATNRPLKALIEAGEFRADLYYRLAVVEVVLPPLRERAEDLELLALHFAATFARRYGRPLRRVGRGALERLRHHPWPGNVRELRNVMDRAVLLSRGSTLVAEDLILETVGGSSPPEGGRPSSPPSPDGAGPFVPPPDAPLKEVEAWHIARALARTGGHMGEAAALLGIHRNTLTTKVREYGLRSGSGERDP